MLQIGKNIQVASELGAIKPDPLSQPGKHSHHVLELVEAVILATVAIATAWSGYQASRWDSMQTELYGQSSRLRMEAQALEVEANQSKIFDAWVVAEWFRSEAHGDRTVARLFEKRILPELRPAFEAWQKTDPVHNVNAPVGPMAMPEYRNHAAELAAQRNQAASALFDQGTQARDHGDRYIRVTVFLATVLLLVAISQRFQTPSIRVFLVVLAFCLLILPACELLLLPRL